ncbi:MAG TPA: hypothetical protein VF663_07150 [Telluria sp.]
MSATDNKDQGTDPGAQGAGMAYEADIGSGEKTPGEKETEEIVKSIPTAPKDQAQPEDKQ